MLKLVIRIIESRRELSTLVYVTCFPLYLKYAIRRRIADEYCGGAAVTKFPTKYFRIELCVESLSCE